jgi:hypothetical protein
VLTVVVLAVVVLAGCGSRVPVTGTIRSSTAILSCLGARHLRGGLVPISLSGPVTPRALIAIVGGGATTDIAVYGTRAAAADAFTRQGTGAAELLAGNTIEQLYGYSLPPGAAVPPAIEQCAFGAVAAPRRSVVYAGQAAEAT